MNATERTMTPEGITITVLDRAVEILTARAKAIVANDILTREEAAAYIRYTPGYLDKLVTQGKIKAHRINGGDARFIRYELLEFVKSQ